MGGLSVESGRCGAGGFHCECGNGSEVLGGHVPCEGGDLAALGRHFGVTLRGRWRIVGRLVVQVATHDGERWRGRTRPSSTSYAEMLGRWALTCPGSRIWTRFVVFPILCRLGSEGVEKEGHPAEIFDGFDADAELAS